MIEITLNWTDNNIVGSKKVNLSGLPNIDEFVYFTENKVTFRSKILKRHFHDGGTVILKVTRPFDTNQNLTPTDLDIVFL